MIKIDGEGVLDCNDSIANFLAFLFTQSREMFGPEY